MIYTVNRLSYESICHIMKHYQIIAPLVAICVFPSFAEESQVDIPLSLEGKKIQFSYSPAYKFTPLVIHCGKSVKDVANSYHLQGEDRTCVLSYEPEKKNKAGKINIKGSKDKAEIQLKFDNASCGTAHMIWNNIKYYQLKFRIQDTSAGAEYLQRMGDPVGDVVPRSLAGKILEVNFKDAVERSINGQEYACSSWKDCYATPFVFQFPASDDVFEIPHLMPHSEETPYPPMKVSYNLIGTCATVDIKGCSHMVEVELDFADSTSGLAHVTLGYEEGFGYEFKGATFTIRDAESASSTVIYPYNFDSELEYNVELMQLIQNLSLTRYETALEKLYQKRVLNGLHAILYGADVNHVLEDANGTTVLHNACGLGHVEIVAWLLKNGADTTVKTAKGATVDDCVGGSAASVIRAMLKESTKKN